MSLALTPYQAQRARWPTQGRHILAQYDDDSVVVYQAYRPSIGRHAVDHQQFGGEWSFDRMSWIKPNFLWMMYRSNWATHPNQEHILAIRLARDGFEMSPGRAFIGSGSSTSFKSPRSDARGSPRRHGSVLILRMQPTKFGRTTSSSTPAPMVSRSSA